MQILYWKRPTRHTKNRTVALRRIRFGPIPHWLLWPTRALGSLRYTGFSAKETEEWLLLRPVRNNYRETGLDLRQTNCLRCSNTGIQAILAYVSSTVSVAARNDSIVQPSQSSVLSTGISLRIRIATISDLWCYIKGHRCLFWRLFNNYIWGLLLYTLISCTTYWVPWVPRNRLSFSVWMYGAHEGK